MIFRSFEWTLLKTNGTLPRERGFAVGGMLLLMDLTIFSKYTQFIKYA